MPSTLGPYSSREECSCRSLVLAAVAENAALLQYASEELRADRAVVEVAVAKHGGALGYASDALRADKSIVLTAVNVNGLALACASEELRADREVVLVAVANHGTALLYAADGLRADKDVVTTAVRAARGSALQYACEELRADEELLLAAVAQDAGSFMCAPEGMRCQRDLAKAALRRNAEVVRFLSSDLLSDGDFREEAQDSLQNAIILRISMLSGRSCCLAWHVEEESQCAGVSKTCVMYWCSWHLPVGPAERPYAQLYLKGEPVPDSDIAHWGLPRGDATDIQLVVSPPTSKRRRDESS
mmetsp:Transcript_39552/g.93113  ORF Transcript_39552/g.93113 Transcript_39552/m.93113 type:complete len:302 (-) Transcript_39552:312-1217(-)